MLSMFKPSTLFTRENAVERLLANPLSTPILVAAELHLIRLFHLRPAQDLPVWTAASLFLLIPAFFVVSFCYLCVPLLIFWGAIPNSIEEGASLTDTTAEASTTTAPAWRADLYRREFFVFILVIPLSVCWLTWSTEVPADHDRFLECVRSLHYPEGLRSLAVSLQAHPNLTKSELNNFCIIPSQADVASAPDKPATVPELVRKYTP